MGIEPWSSYQYAGLENAIQNKNARKLKAGTNVKTWLTTVAYESKDEINHISQAGEVT